MRTHRQDSGWRRVVSLAAAMLLAACGGGSPEPATPAAGAARDATPDMTRDMTRERASVLQGAPIAPDAHLNGMWSRVYDWPMIAVHAVLMPDGRVLSYGTNAEGRQTGLFHYDFWEGVGAPDTGHLTLQNTSGTDIFCSTQLLLQSGDVWIAGGDIWNGKKAINDGNNNSNTVSAADNSILRGPNMQLPRWYATAITLQNGEIYVQGGDGGGAAFPEVRQSDGSFRALSTIDSSYLNIWYPRNFVAPDGRIFGYEVSGIMYWIDPAGSGSLARAGRFEPQYRGNDSSAAMFRPGRILQFGGQSNGAIVIDINSGAPLVTPTQSLSSQRRHVASTILPDGKVLATGGSQIGNRLEGVNNRAETWDPQSEQWTLGAEGALARLYHSNALLLPDASVLVMGGGANGPLSNLNVELYYPPYLFGADGQLAPRPSIVAAPTNLELTKSFSIEVAGTNPVARVTLLKTASTTHSFNSEQRFRDLTYSVLGPGTSPDSTQLRVQAPARSADAPPGYYHLFVLDSAGVPSVSSIVRIGIEQPLLVTEMPVLQATGDQSGMAGAAVGLQLVASDPIGQPLRYAAAGLPSGVSLDPTSGLLSGAPDTPGSYHFVLSVEDGVNVTDAHAVWRVSGPPQAAITSLPAPTPIAVGGTASYTAEASGSNVLYRWNFGDGSPETAPSAAPSASHTYSRAGTFPVTLTVVDDGGVPQSRSFLQAVHLPPTAASPSVSSNLLVEKGAGGVERLWVVNQDQDSVSAFDANTHRKLGEVAVGRAPRSIARAADGRLWVSNKESASISVIDPDSMQRVETIALPRASMPFGIAMSPREAIAYVALEASGELLSFDTASFFRVGAAPVGLHARHVSVTQDGASVFVSRFITPPLPGEGTPQLATTGITQGGEVLVVDAATMQVAQTITLGISEQQDAPTQGRGVPNFLGPVALSPDGTQAWVPSKQDNVQRGALRDGNPLDFETTVRAISSRIDLADAVVAEDLDSRIDHDDASMASAALFDPLGVLLFVALETSREVAVLDVHGGFQLLRFAAGRAPQGLALSAAGRTLYVNNFMDRTVGVYDLSPLLERGESRVPLATTLKAVADEKLAAEVLLGKQLFYDARDPRLARDRYMSCASCHNDGAQDGRVWDMTSLGEGLRNTISLRGRGGAGARLHWSHNFDELQDFETQIRNLAGGSGLMPDAELAAGTRALPLGDNKAGVSRELDALAAYVASLATFDASPRRGVDGALSEAAIAGRAVFEAGNCAACHTGATFGGSAASPPADIGTIKASSGQRSGGLLDRVKTPSLRDVWATAPYLHDGSAATLSQAVAAHKGVQLAEADLQALLAYLGELGGEAAEDAV